MNPYVGPRAFQENEREFFFGRDEETAILEGLVMTRRVALFFAQSGAGKSSLLRAGLIPELTRQQTLGSGQRARTYQKMCVLPILTVGRALTAESDGSVANIYIHSALLGLHRERAASDLAGMTLAGALAPFFADECARRGSAGHLRRDPAHLRPIRGAVHPLPRPVG